MAHSDFITAAITNPDVNGGTMRLTLLPASSVVVQRLQTIITTPRRDEVAPRPPVRTMPMCRGRKCISIRRVGAGLKPVSTKVPDSYSGRAGYALRNVGVLPRLLPLFSLPDIDRCTWRLSSWRGSPRQCFPGGDYGGNCILSSASAVSAAGKWKWELFLATL